MSHRVLVVGPSSGLAEEFVLSAPSEWTFEGVGRSGPVRAADRYDGLHLVDARELGPLEYAIRANDCDCVVSFLQEGDRRRCQEERPLPGAVPAGLAWDLNVLATEAIGRAAVAERKRVIVVSTDEIFPEGNGPATEPTEPLPWTENPSWYGGTWSEAETLLGRLRGSVAILRVSALFGWTFEPDCDRRLASELARRRSDAPERVQPTFVPDAVRAIRRLVEDPVAGPFHVALAQEVARPELANQLQRTLPGSVSAHDVVPERHPGLVPGRLADFGVRPTPLMEALEILGGLRHP